MSEPLLSLSEVSKVFRSGTENLEILRGVCLDVEAASSVVVTGESGCGKSTLLNLIAGLDTVSAGRIRALSYEVSALGEDDLVDYRRRSLGLVFQSHYLLKEFSALENVMLPGLIAGRRETEVRRRARQLLDEVGLGERIGHYPVQLSGGERQRAAVARALINEPPLILADEPTGNLDEENSRSMQDLLLGLVRAHGVTLLLVTHDSGFAARGDLRYRLHGGRLERSP